MFLDIFPLSSLSSLAESLSASQRLGLDFSRYYPDTGRVLKQLKRSGPQSTAQSYGPDCDAEVRPEAIDSLDTLEDALFMMETSGGSRLTARQACGVESAAMKARQTQGYLWRISVLFLAKMSSMSILGQSKGTPCAKF